MKSLIKTIALIDSCCVYSFLKDYGIRGQSLSLLGAELLALKIGVHRQTIYKWNKKVRAGYYAKCPKCPPNGDPHQDRLD